jgi:MOSC domain-containing protein YiiM
MGEGRRIVSVNVGEPRTVPWRGREVTTAIWKSPVDGPVAVAGVSIAGDGQADRRVHGGPDKAVYAYAAEDYEWWSAELGDGALAPGTFGENLTVAGIDVTGSRIGDRWTIGDVVLEVREPRQPCYKLGIRMGDDDFPDHFTAAGRPGTYLRIVQPGTLQAGDGIEVEVAAEPHITVGALVSDEQSPAFWTTVAHDNRVPTGWRRTATRLAEPAAPRDPTA